MKRVLFTFLIAILFVTSFFGVSVQPIQAQGTCDVRANIFISTLHPDIYYFDATVSNIAPGNYRIFKTAGTSVIQLDFTVTAGNTGPYRLPASPQWDRATPKASYQNEVLNVRVVKLDGAGNPGGDLCTTFKAFAEAVPAAISDTTQEVCTMGTKVTRLPDGSFVLVAMVDQRRLNPDTRYTLIMYLEGNGSYSSHGFFPDGANFARVIYYPTKDFAGKSAKFTFKNSSGGAVAGCPEVDIPLPATPITPLPAGCTQAQIGEPQCIDFFSPFDDDGVTIDPGAITGVDPIELFTLCGQLPTGSAQRTACENCADYDIEGRPTRIYSALGCIPVDEQGFLRQAIQLLLSVSGLIALLSILAGAFMLSTSQGDSNQVKKAKELITAAVSGLLFIIFSTIILDFIGVQILRIPGLS